MVSAVLTAVSLEAANKDKYPLSTQQSLSEDDQAHIARLRLSLAEQLIEEGETLEPRHKALFDELREKTRAYPDKFTRRSANRPHPPSPQFLCAPAQQLSQISTTP
jgi:hypothetical protein